MINRYASDIMMQGAMDRERQKELDRRNCKPGYQYNELLGKCVPPYSAVIRDKGLQAAGPAPSIDGPSKDTSTPTSTTPMDDAIRAEKNKRMSAKAQKTAQASPVNGGSTKV